LLLQLVTPEATQCHQCLDVEVDNRKIQPLSHCDVFYDAQILPHGFHQIRIGILQNNTIERNI
jgi:hypothetical protein